MAPRLALVTGAVFATLATSVLGDGKMVDVMQPTKVCPKDFDLYGKTCTRESWREPTFTCEKGAKLRDGMCISTMHIKGEYVCPPGYHSKGHNKCFAIDTVSPTVSCRDGSLPDSFGQCYLFDELEPYYSCPHGFKKSADGLCYAESKVKSDEICPPGSTPSKYGCVTYEQAMPETLCSKGYELIGEACVKSKIHKEISSCPKSFHRVDRGLQNHESECVKAIHVEGSLFCDEGILDGKKCKKVFDTMPTMGCKKDYDLINGECVKTVVEAPKLDCPKGAKLDNGRCIEILSLPSLTACPSGQIQKHGKCEELVYMPAILECPKGAEYIHGQCVSSHTKSSKVTCPFGFRMTEQGCRKQIKVPSERLCPAGELDGLHCVTYETVQATPKCKHGQFSDNGLCVTRKSTKSRVTCADGYKLDGESCVKTVHVEVDLQCSKGEAVHGGKCRKEILSSPLSSCPHGFTLEGNVCMSYDEREPQYRCMDKSYKLVHGACIQEGEKFKQYHEFKPKKHAKDVIIKKNKQQSNNVFNGPAIQYHGASYSMH